MGDEIKVDVYIFCAVTFGHFCLDEFAFLQNELVQKRRVLGQIAPPIVGELETGKMIGPVINLAGLSESFVSEATDP